jgi:hypothetical protein
MWIVKTQTKLFLIIGLFLPRKRETSKKKTSIVRVSKTQDWSKKSIEQIINIKNDKLVRKKLINLKNKYIKLHSKKNLIKEFLKIIKK